MAALAQAPEPGVRSNTTLALTSLNKVFQHWTDLRSCQNNGIPTPVSKISPCGVAGSAPITLAFSVTAIRGNVPQGAGSTPVYVVSWVDSSPAWVN